MGGMVIFVLICFVCVCYVCLRWLCIYMFSGYKGVMTLVCLGQ